MDTVSADTIRPLDVECPSVPDRIRIVSTTGTCGGRPRIDGHRVTVEDIAVWHERLGQSPDEIVSGHPTLTLSDVHAALAYYYENRERMDAAIAESERYIAALRAKAPPSLLGERIAQRKVDAAVDSIPPR